MIPWLQNWKWDCDYAEWMELWKGELATKSLLQWVSQHRETVDHNLTLIKLCRSIATSPCEQLCDTDRHAQSHACADHSEPQQ